MEAGHGQGRVNLGVQRLDVQHVLDERGVDQAADRCGVQVLGVRPALPGAVEEFGHGVRRTGTNQERHAQAGDAAHVAAP